MQGIGGHYPPKEPEIISIANKCVTNERTERKEKQQLKYIFLINQARGPCNMPVEYRSDVQFLISLVNKIGFSCVEQLIKKREIWIISRVAAKN